MLNMSNLQLGFTSYNLHTVTMCLSQEGVTWTTIVAVLGFEPKLS